jgi:homocysteine S-methyltransferase
VREASVAASIRSSIADDDGMDVVERFRAPLVIDGGLATQLERLGADLSDELWSARLLLDEPDLIRQVHRSYFDAGADVAIGASYQASFEGFARLGVDRAGTVALLRRSVELAREAASATGRPGLLVAASVGPYGAVLADGSEYIGRYGMSVEQLIAFHEPRLDTLLDAEPDLLAVETIPSIVEAEGIVRLLESRSRAHAWITFSCRDDERISDGTPIVEAASVAASCPAVIGVGVNCTPPRLVAGLLRRVRRSLPETPLVAYPNLGSTWDPAARAWRAEGPRPDFGVCARSWLEEGATAIGGCCGTGPDDVAAIASVVDGA